MKTAVKKLRSRFLVDDGTRALMRRTRELFPNNAHARRTRADGADKLPVLLVDFTDLVPWQYFASKATGYLQEGFPDCRVAAFDFADSRLDRLGLPKRKLQALYKSFGAKLELTFKDGGEFDSEARAWAEREWPKLKTKDDILALAINGLKVGDFIYDSILRVSADPTVEVSDFRLKPEMAKAYVAYKLCERYFERNDVKAILTTHMVYVSHGVLSRMAMQRKIPVLVNMSLEQLNTVEIDPEIYYHLNYHHYRETFSALTPAEQAEGRERGKKLLQARLAGVVDKGIADIFEPGRPGLHGYGPERAERIMKDSGKPRVIVMLPCFFDAPHCYRFLLFPDFWEWITFLLDEASKTGFDWYVKPHPGGLPQNDAFLGRLRQLYPKIHFLGRGASNKQILKEGVNAMFTVFGTAAHEFAYCGIPAVNAGDNPHIQYGFNFHPKTREEYRSLIQSADRLQLSINKTEIEEMVYLHYLHSTSRPNRFNAVCIPPEYAVEAAGSMHDKAEFFLKLIASETDASNRNLRAYFQDLFGKYFGKTAHHSAKNSLGLPSL